MHAAVENFVAGRLAHFADTWKLLTSDVSILKTVAGGEIELDREMQELGVVTGSKPKNFSDREAAAIDEETEELLWSREL